LEAHCVTWGTARVSMQVYACCPHLYSDHSALLLLMLAANCGVSSSELLRCSRCKASWYCSLKCHAAYWPFHREFCRKNDFADALHQSEPSFAAWMRKHHKQAVLKVHLNIAGLDLSNPAQLP